MDRRRASEISNSREMINVTYNGKLIYIENITPAKDTASIHFLSRPENSQEVPLSDLLETKSF